MYMWLTYSFDIKNFRSQSMDSSMENNIKFICKCLHVFLFIFQSFHNKQVNKDSMMEGVTECERI